MGKLIKKFKYLREYEFLRETILTCLLGAQMEWINEFKKCQKKSRDTATLKTNPDPIEILQSWARDKVLSFSHKKNTIIYQ